MGKEESERARKNQKRCWRTVASYNSGVSILNFGNFSLRILVVKALKVTVYRTSSLMGKEPEAMLAQKRLV